MKVEIISLVFLILIVGVYSQTDDKCLLPDERKAVRSSKDDAFTTINSIPINEEKTKKSKEFRSATRTSEDVKKGIKRLNRQRGNLRRIKQATKVARRYCQKPIRSQFQGFKIKNFKQTVLCPGNWVGIKIQKVYFDDNDDDCWTLPTFTSLTCPTYNCNGMLHLSLNNIDKISNTSTKVSFGEFVDYFKNLNISEDKEDPVIDFDKLPDENVNNILNSAITADEILKTVKNLNNNKASGYDDIVNEHIKNTIHILLPI